MQRWATTTKATLPPPQRTPRSKGKGKMPQATTSRDGSEQRYMTTSYAVSSRNQGPSARSSRRGPAIARRSDVQDRARRTPSVTVTMPITLPTPTITSPRPCRAPTFSPNRRHHNRPPTTAPAQSPTGLKRQQPHYGSMPDPKARRQQTSGPGGRRVWSADHSTTRSGNPLPAAPRRLDMSASSALPRNPPVPDHTAADREQAPPTTDDHQNAGKRRREPNQDVDQPTRKQTRRKQRSQKGRPTDVTK